MSDHIPLDIQVDIIKRLPVKSLIQFRSVSKAWKSLIDSTDFIYTYKSQQQHLFVRYANDSNDFDHKYVLVIDDDTFPQHKLSLTLPPLAKIFNNFPRIRGSSHGLVFLYGDHVSLPGSSVAVIWNPSIRKAVGVVVSNEHNERPFLGFWVRDNDPKIIRIRQIKSSKVLESIVEIFTLSTGAWRRTYSNLPRKSIQFESPEVTIDGFIYWAATRNTTEGDYYNLIISFDMKSEKFREIKLPHSLAHYTSCENVCISKLKNSLAVLIIDDQDGLSFDVWTMEDGVSKSFRKLYTICTPHAVFYKVLSELSPGVTNIVDYLCQQFKEDSSLAAYKPYSKQIDNLGITGSMDSLYVFPYIETLLLLDQPDSVIYEEGKHYNFKELRNKVFQRMQARSFAYN